MRWILAAIVIAATNVGPGSAVQAGKGDAPSCDMIVKAFKQSGFSPKGKEGAVLAVDCVRPLMLGAIVAHPDIPLPEIDPALVIACQAEKPGFGGVKERPPAAGVGQSPSEVPAPVLATRPPRPARPTSSSS